MAFVNVFGSLGLHDVEFSGQVEEVVVEVRVGHDLDDVIVLVLVQILQPQNNPSFSRPRDLGPVP